MTRAKAALLSPPLYLGFLLLVAAAAAVHMILLGPALSLANPPWGPYTHYNNYLIFKASFAHLVAGKDLYALYPAEHFDYYKYSPTFAALMAPFAFLPTALGLVLFNLLNAAVLAVAIWKLPVLDARAKGFFAWYIAPEFLGAAQGTQTNILVLGLIVLAFEFCERKSNLAASLVVVLAFYIKLFGLFAGLLFLLYPQRKRLVLFTAAWLVLLGLLPLLLVSPRQLAFLYGSWADLLRADRLASIGSPASFSVMGWLNAWFHIVPNPLLVVGAGLALALVPLANVRAYGDFHFRLTFLAAILIWVVIFNHKAESPTFVIAAGGVALWYFSRPRRPWRSLLAWLSFALTSLAYSDLTPSSVKAHLVFPLVLKVVGPTLVWLAVIWEEWRWPQAARADEPTIA
jgi:hypothetical protein